MEGKRPLTTVKYELELITGEAQVREEFITSYDSEFYNEDMESTDCIFVTMRVEDLKEKYGDDLCLLEFTVEREMQVIN